LTAFLGCAILKKKTFCWEKVKIMTTNKFQSEVLKKANEILSRLPRERSKNIIGRRFGLRNGNRETLEAIGHDYNITRERVRQIESDTLKILTDARNLAIIKPIFDYLDNLFEEHGYLIGEKRLLDLITNVSKPHPARSATIMALNLGKPYQKFNESPKFYSYWATKKQPREQTKRIINSLVEHLNKQNRTFTPEKILDIISSKHKNAPQKLVENSLNISKEIDENIFGEIGLSNWPEINPKGARDMAYLVLKKETKPHHFTNITELINKTNLSSSQAFPQTVHNELIKDKRFVLVGRGIYALREWGYEPGTVKEVIIKVLNQTNKPLSKNEIVSAVLEKRQIRPNTVVINLQNNEEFERLEDGRYILCREL